MMIKGYIQGQKVNLEVKCMQKYIFLILAIKYFSCIGVVIQGHLQSQKQI